MVVVEVLTGRCSEDYSRVSVLSIHDKRRMDFSRQATVPLGHQGQLWRSNFSLHSSYASPPPTRALPHAIRGPAVL